MSLPNVRFNLILLFSASLWAIAGCQSQPKALPPPLVSPAMFTQIDHYTGTPLSGPRVAVADVGVPQDSLNVSVKWIATLDAPTSVHETLASQCRLIIAGQSGIPMLASPDLTKNILFAQGSAVLPLQTEFNASATTNFAPIVKLEGALPPGVTANFLAVGLAGPPPRSHIVIRIARSTGATTAPTTQGTPTPLEMTLEIAQDASVSSTHPSISKSETAVFDRSLVNDHDRIALVIPMTFSDSPARALIALIDISRITTAALLAQCHADLEGSAETAAKEPNVGAVEGSAWAGYDSALKGLWQPADRRAALVFLAAQTGAHICEDVALVADAPTLEKLANTISERTAASSEPHTAAALSWLLDRAAFELLALNHAPGNTAAGGNAASVPLAPELRAILTVYAGEPGRHTGSLDDIAHQSTSRQDLENRLTAENLVFLTDASPASRVRAFDWLKSRGLAPAGFDPLGPGKQRREALDKALASGTN